MALTPINNLAKVRDIPNASGQGVSTDLTAPLPAALPIDLNSSSVSCPAKDLCLHQLIEAQVARTPNETAVVFEQTRLTYRELSQRADLLAAHLQELGVRPDQVVGLFVERSAEMMIGILGILKAGAAYLPIDAAYPKDRIAFMLADANATALITQTNLLEKLPSGSAARAICLDSYDWSKPGQKSLNAQTTPANLAYVIYTSGSTGKPKGVGIEHRNIVNYVLGVSERVRLEPGMNHAMVSTIAADLGNTVIFPALTTGGCLHLISQERAESQGKLSEYFTRERIDVLKIVPSHLAALQTGRNPEHVIPRKRLILGGEASRIEWVTRLKALAPGCTIFNHYGPTETTVGVLAYEFGAQPPNTISGSLPLGKPLPNSRIYLLDENRNPVAVGTEGEIFVGGAGVARGYLERLELTAEKFVPDTFSPTAGGRMYRTGDLARALPDGNLEFCGRIDDQVKIHGYRIELGEIEGVLRQQPGIRDALVLASEDTAGNKQLVAYLIPQRVRQPLWTKKTLYFLPDGSPVAYSNKQETEQDAARIFGGQNYLRHGIAIRPGDCVLDIGAKTGLFSIFASRAARDLRIICLESDPADFGCLALNAEAWVSGAKCLPFGIGRELQSAETEFFGALSQRNYALSSDQTRREALASASPQSSERNERFAEEITGSTDSGTAERTAAAQHQSLSSIIAAEGIDRIDLLRVRANENDLDALRELTAAEWSKIGQVVIETDDGQSLKPIAEMLQCEGFVVTVDSGSSALDTQTSYLYAIAPRATKSESDLRPANDPGQVISTSEVEQILTPVTLRKKLKYGLPQYMVPAAFILMDKFPLNANGKIDRKALPAFTHEAAQVSHDLVLPSNETERTLAEIWSDLLKVETIGIHDNFFDLGGHSLLAIKAASRIRDSFGVDLPAQTLFESSTIAQLAKLIQKTTTPASSAPRIERRKHAGPYHLSASEEQFWFLNQLVPECPVYNVVDVIPLGEKANADALARTLRELVQRHEILRTAFSYNDGQPMQTVLPSATIEIDELNLVDVPAPEQEREWFRIVHEQGRKPFDLTKVPLLRATVVHWSEQKHELLLAIHHIIADEWSMEVLHKEVTQLYERFLQGLPSPLKELPIQYADFACWQREWLKGGVLERQLNYWKEQLEGAPRTLEIPSDKPRPTVPTFRGATEVFQLPPAITAPLKALGRDEKATLFMVLQASFMAFLYRYTGQSDILIGTPISGRTQTETEKLIGCFLNTVVLRGQMSQSLTFRALLRQVRTRAMGAYAHADIPFKYLVAELATARDPSRSPLFQVMFILHDPDGVSEVSRVSGKHQLETGTSKFDLTLSVSETDHGLEGLLEYSTDLFESETVRRMAALYSTLLESIATDPDQRVSALQMLASPDRRKLLVEWNQTQVTFPGRDLSLSQCIEQQVAKTPDRIALVSERKDFTYGELDRRANQLARHLRELGVGPDVLVGLCIERSVEMVVAILGVLKAGGAYLPLDPSFPRNRLAFMVEDSGINVLLTHRGLEKNLPVRPTVVLDLNVDWAQIAQHSSASPDWRAASSQNLAYVLYTSGSTGKPKGVEIPHSAIVNFLFSMQREPGLSADDTLLAVTTLSFDIAGLELFLPLITGAKVVLASREDGQEPTRLVERISESACTVMQATPATWRALINAGWRGAPNLKILCGGEALLPDLAAELLSRCEQLWNMYGPTETTVWSTIHNVTSVDGTVSIGQPIANTKVYVLDALRNLVPPGSVGELYIAGDGLARGYLKREELTRERFVADPFESNRRMYRTGDLARWNPGGTIECLGRVDSQVKLRGYRIELGEIETVLASHPAVRQCVVIAWQEESSEKAAGKTDDAPLVAYFETRSATPPSVSELRDYLQKDLPVFMIPSAFVPLERLPLTPNGKVDRKLLPAPAMGLAGNEEFMVPRDAVEEALTRIWSKVLRVKNIGLQDNFFALGGHSLLAVRITTDIEKLTKIRIPLATLLQAPTIAGLAAILRSKNWTPSWSSLVPLRTTGSRQPIFLMHAHGGNVLEYQALAKMLDPEHPVYAFQARGLDGNIPEDLTMEQMASAYIEELRDLQPEGPYTLAGFCFGGLLALEAAQQLQAAGQEVAQVILIQTTHPATFRFKPEIGQIRRVWYRLAKRVDLEIENLSHAGQGYLAGRVRRAWDLMRAQAAISRDRRRGIKRTNLLGLPKLYIFEALRMENGKALAKYVPRPYSGHVILLRAGRRLTGLVADEYLGWKNYFGADLDVCEVPGHQQNLMLEPNVRELAREINSRLEAAYYQQAPVRK